MVDDAERELGTMEDLLKEQLKHVGDGLKILKVLRGAVIAQRDKSRGIVRPEAVRSEAILAAQRELTNLVTQMPHIAHHIGSRGPLPRQEELPPARPPQRPDAPPNPNEYASAPMDIGPTPMQMPPTTRELSLVNGVGTAGLLGTELPFGGAGVLGTELPFGGAGEFYEDPPPPPVMPSALGAEPSCMPTGPMGGCGGMSGCGGVGGGPMGSNEDGALGGGRPMGDCGMVGCGGVMPMGDCAMGGCGGMGAEGCCGMGGGGLIKIGDVTYMPMPMPGARGVWMPPPGMIVDGQGMPVLDSLGYPQFMPPELVGHLAPPMHLGACPPKRSYNEFMMSAEPKPPPQIACVVAPSPRPRPTTPTSYPHLATQAMLSSYEPPSP